MRWRNPLELLRGKWSTVPAGGPDRVSSSELLELDESELVRRWTRMRGRDIEGDGFALRGWYHELYREFVRGKRILDVGCGLGLSGVTFAQQGASVTFADIVESNVLCTQKLCAALGLDGQEFLYMDTIDALIQLPNDFDAILVLGSLHHAPFEAVKREAAELVRHLKVGGRWLQLAYPEARWRRDGKPPFSRWGEITDGMGTPWAEWYDLEKTHRLLDPARFETVFHYEWHDAEFNWFDLRLVSK